MTTEPQTEEIDFDEIEAELKEQEISPVVAAEAAAANDEPMLDISLDEVAELDEKAALVGVNITWNGERTFHRYENAMRWGADRRLKFGKAWNLLQKMEALENPTERQNAQMSALQIALIETFAPSIPREAVKKMPVAYRGTIVMDFLLKAVKVNPFFRAMIRSS